MVKKVVPILIKDGHYDYPYLGLTSQEELPLSAIEMLKLPQTTGAYVVEVVPGGPADKPDYDQEKQKPISMVYYPAEI